jgi:hypothetical protein
MIFLLFLVLVGLLKGANSEISLEILLHPAHDNHDCFTLMTNVCGHAMPFQIRMNLTKPKHMFLPLL